jgi:hypothetical protein
MANAYKIVAGDMVSYLCVGSVRWQQVKVTTVTNQNNLVLAYVNQNGTRTAINGGAAVPRWTRTRPLSTNTWRPY